MSKIDVINVLTVLLTGALSALIGTFLGAHFSYKEKYDSVRKIAIKALNVFKNYAKKSYKEAENQFNNELSIIEKRAVVVALQKIGIPFLGASTNSDFNINNLNFRDIMIDEDEIDEMIRQIKKGICDNLFFEDVESYFTSNLRLKTLRDIGKKYVEEVLSKSHIRSDNANRIVYPSNWMNTNTFSPGEIQTLYPLRCRTVDRGYFASDGSADPEKIKNLIREIDLGIWDNCLLWDYDAYRNIQTQNELVNLIHNPSTLFQPIQNSNKQDLEKKDD